MKKKQKNKAYNMLKLLLIFIIVVFISLQIILTSIEGLKEDEKLSEEQVELELKQREDEIAQEATETVILDKLSQMKERDRIEYYFSLFIQAVEGKRYEEAYAMLYDEFKENYFPNLESFETYAKKTFPKMSIIEHTNFERNGDTYVMFINISSALSSSKEGREMNFIIKENAVNDFVMSFSVI